MPECMIVIWSPWIESTVLVGVSNRNLTQTSFKNIEDRLSHLTGNLEVS